jgi:tetratricopeptide (TPR) repeat protein
VIGLGIFLVILEAGLNLGGFVLLSIQEHRNILSLKASAQYRIMCIGESTTALGGDDSYPAQLERILNQINLNLRISVINKGVSRVDSSKILQQLEENLDKYKPNMVITMMGINDFNGSLSYVNDSGSFLNYSKTYKLIKLIWLSVTNRLSGVFQVKDRSQKEDHEYNMSFSEDVLRKAVELNPDSDSAYVELANFYAYGEKDAKAKELFKKAIELNPRNDYAYAGLGWCYRKEGSLLKAEELFKKALELNPGNNQACVELGRYYYQQGKRSEADKLFKKALDSDPASYIDVGSFYISQDNLVKAEEVFTKAIVADPADSRAYGALALLCDETGRPEFARQYYEKSRQSQLKHLNSLTRDNYNKIKEILDKRKVRLMCVQYPMRSIKPLMAIFTGWDGIVFVDNEKVFKEAVRKEGVKEYFWDMFGGDFGHCTSKGNRLLAQNIANALVKAGVFSDMKK